MLSSQLECHLASLVYCSSQLGGLVCILRLRYYKVLGLKKSWNVSCLFLQSQQGTHRAYYKVGGWDTPNWPMFHQKGIPDRKVAKSEKGSACPNY